MLLYRAVCIVSEVSRVRSHPYKEYMYMYMHRCTAFKKKIKRSSFITEFADYVEKLSCLNCRLIIVGDCNINWLDNNDSERKQFYILLQTFGLVQRIGMPTYQNGHLLDYIINRESGNFASNFGVSVVYKD